MNSGKKKKATKKKLPKEEGSVLKLIPPLKNILKYDDGDEDFIEHQRKVTELLNRLPKSTNGWPDSIPKGID